MMNPAANAYGITAYRVYATPAGTLRMAGRSVAVGDTDGTPTLTVHDTTTGRSVELSFDTVDRAMEYAMDFMEACNA